MKINEIFRSIQGESSWQGLPCTFIRLSGCNLRCSYCDTKYAYDEGKEMSVKQILHTVTARFPASQPDCRHKFNSCLPDAPAPVPAQPVREAPCACPKIPPRLVEITGGEPLLQEKTCKLAEALISRGDTVLIETNGSFPVDNLPPEVIRIMDVKCPGSGMSDKVCWGNLDNLKQSDEIKFVLCSRSDYDWAKHVIDKHGLIHKASVLFSPATDVTDELSPRSLAEWILSDDLSVRFQPQLHKYVGLR
jgi:7-carboxy-7-deazaguanine synthase